ncbi:hypothetical protein [Agrobacterium rosae]|uniref:hypothetical protein n=1 Tax=Agrobacterium rosae TaxID=1972867 RepID=UPI003B9EAEAD
MNSQNDNTDVEFSPEKIEEMKAIAALPWTQWMPDERAWTPPGNGDWVKAVNPHLISVRLAYASMFHTREQTMAAMKVMDEEGIFKELIEGIEEAIEFIEPMLKVLRSAEARFMVAGSAVILADMGEPA